MNDKHLDQWLDELRDHSIPEPDQASKNAAIQMASTEFKENLSQGNIPSARPIGNRDIHVKNTWFSNLANVIESFFMTITTSQRVYQVAAMGCFAALVVYMLPPTQTYDDLEEITDIANQEGHYSAEVASGSRAVEKKIELAQRVDVAPVKKTMSPLKNKAALSKNNYALEEVVVSQNVDHSGRFSRAAPLHKQENELDDLVSTSVIGAADVNSSSRLASKSVAASLADPRQRRSVTVDNDQLGIHRQDHREEYAEYKAHSIKQVADKPVSTFSIDVDTASYSLVRNQLSGGYLPKPQAVRAEELINYFDYNYPEPDSKSRPFEPSISVLDSPWNKNKKLIHIGIKGYDISAGEQPDSNLVFLLDVSGSMNSTKKLPLVKQSISLLLDTLKPNDTVSIVVYAGAAGLVLEPTQAKEKGKIMTALQRLNAGGSTAGSAGIQLAYELAEQNFNKASVNRIILATDGDFNVGQQSNEDLKTLVKHKRDSGVFLSVLGFGRNNYQDDMMQVLAQNGNGVAVYIDSLSEAKKVLVDEATSTLFPIAKDVKIQVEFNPATVSEYRLVGYETRHLNREDFNNDKVDAGDIGAGHTVTAIYEITPANASNQSIDELRYLQSHTKKQFDIAVNTQSNEFGFLKIRYKLPNESKSTLIEQAIVMRKDSVSSEVSFSVAVAGFAQLLAGSQYTGELAYEDVIDTALSNKGSDPFGYRTEFIQLVRMAKIAQP